MTPVAAPLVIGLIVQDAVLATETGKVPLPAGTRVQVVERAERPTPDPSLPELGYWHHKVQVDGKRGTVSSAKLALPAASAFDDFGWDGARPVTGDLDGDGVLEEVWLGVTEGAELYEGEVHRRNGTSWLICDDGERSTAVSLHEDNGWGTTAHLERLERVDLTGDGNPELWMRFSTTVTEVGQGSDELVVAGLFAGKLRTLLRIEEGSVQRMGLSQYFWGRVRRDGTAVVHDAIDLDHPCEGPGRCIARTVTTWRWREDHVAFVPMQGHRDLRATVRGQSIALADEPGGEPTRTVTEDLDRITVLRMTEDPHSPRQLRVRVGDFGKPGWVPAESVTLDADYLDLRPQ